MRNAILLLALGLALRLLFQMATADRWDAFAVAFQGDAPVWQDLAFKAHAGLEDELFKLPLRPPGMHWLVSALWDGTADDSWRLRLWFALLSAAIAPLLYLLLRPHVTEIRALAVGGLCAASTSLLLLGSGPHSELPYLVLVLVSLFDQQRLRTSPTAVVALRWGILHALICLLRAEHVLTFVVFIAVLAVQRAPNWRRTAALALGAWALALVPWHITAFAKVDAYNRAGAPPLPAAGVTLPGALPWSAAALARLRTAPAFQQGPVFQFITDTVRARGRTAVDVDDLDIVQEAYGTWPEPLPRPFLCLYGGLNFFLANSPEADSGFSGSALDRAPPLLGGSHRYPPGLLRVLPRSGTLVLSYPPHLGRLAHGYRDGIAELLDDPTAAAGRIAGKLWHAAEGAASGLGGYGLPIGLSGERRPVDFVTATGAWPALYRTLLLVVALVGLWSLRKMPWLLPWLAFALTKLLVIAAFFGYARQGALITPVVMIGVVAALPRIDRLRARVLWGALIALLGVELLRTFTTEVALELPDGTQVTTLPQNDHRPVRVHYR